MRVHVVQTGSLVGNQTFMRGESWSTLFRRRENFEFPVYTYLVEHPDGPFPESTALTDSGDIRIVPIPGHSIAQVGVLVPSDGVVVFFGADHVLRQDWFVEDYAKGRLVGLGLLGNPKLAVETSRRIQRFAETVPTVFLPAHDAGAPAPCRA